MLNSKEILWEVLPTEAPLYVKKCSKCKVSKHFYCSGKFRMNNQKKNSDVWLIYKCTECDNTFNITILSRVKPHLMDSSLYEKFINNDFDTALTYSLDREIINKNQIQIDYESVKYDIKDESNLSLNDMIYSEEQEIKIKIIYPVNLNLKLSRILREKLNLSFNQLEKILENNTISISSFDSLKRDKIKNDTVITIYRERLRSYILSQKQKRSIIE